MFDGTHTNSEYFKSADGRTSSFSLHPHWIRVAMMMDRILRKSWYWKSCARNLTSRIRDDTQRVEILTRKTRMQNGVLYWPLL